MWKTKWPFHFCPPPYLVVMVYGLHCRLANALEHDGVAEADSEQGQQIDCQERIEDETAFLALAGEGLNAVGAQAIPVANLGAMIHSHGE